MKRSCAPSSRRTPRAELFARRTLGALCRGALALGFAACDRGVPIPDVDPAPLRVVDVSVGPDRPWRAGDAIVIAFDRYLDPRTATRQSFAVVDGFNTLTANPLVIYDPETRTVTLANAGADGEAWLPLDQPYTLVIGIPQAGELLGGVRGLDGGTLTADQTLRVPFFARAALEADSGEPVTQPVSYCEQVQPLFTRACARCHDGTASGLDLRSAAGVRSTALGVIARGATRGALSSPTPSTAIFGQGAALVDPPSAATSYLLSKVLAREPGAGESRASCTEPPRPEPLPKVAVLADPGPEERARLHSFLQGEAMPPPGSAEAPLDLDERRMLSRWIREGAPTASCSSTCTP